MKRSQTKYNWQAVMFGSVAIFGCSLFLLAVITLHFLRWDYSPLRHDLSEYAVGPNGIIMVLAFFGLSAGSFALAIGLYYSRLEPSNISIALLVIFAISVLLAGIFPTDLSGDAMTTAGTIHGIASMVGLVGGLAAIVLLTTKMEKGEQWKDIYRPASVLALLGPGTFLIWILVLGPLGVSGLGQRTLVVFILSWFLLVAFQLRKISR